MDHTKFVRRLSPPLRQPVLVVAFEGWNDAGEAASTAVGFLGANLGAQTFAVIDPEEYYDFQQTRPTVRLVDGVHRRLDWPGVEFQAVRLPQGARDVVLLRGHEPNLRWRSFAREVLDVCHELGVELIVTVGALLADVPHTRPVQVVGSAPDPTLAEELGLAASRYEGPTGILGVLSDAARTSDLPAVSLWAALPHYVQASPNPRAALALVERVRELLRLPVETATLREATAAFDATVADIVADDPELAVYVERLEAETDQEEESLADLPPEQLVAEVERFLRDHPGGRS